MQAARYDPASGAWGSPTTLGSGKNYQWQQRITRLVVNAAGQALAAWIPAAGTVPAAYAQAALLDPKTGSWGAAHSFSAIKTGNIVAPGLGSRGHAAIAGVNAAATGLWVARLDPGTAKWSPERNVATISGTNLARPWAALDPDGNLVLVWRAAGASSGQAVWTTRYLAASGTWEKAWMLSDTSSSIEGPRLAPEPGGSIVATWSSSRSVQAAIYR